MAKYFGYSLWRVAKHGVIGSGQLLWALGVASINTVTTFASRPQDAPLDSFGEDQDMSIDRGEFVADRLSDLGMHALQSSPAFDASREEAYLQTHRRYSQVEAMRWLRVAAVNWGALELSRVIAEPRNTLGHLRSNFPVFKQIQDAITYLTLAPKRLRRKLPSTVRDLPAGLQDGEIMGDIIREHNSSQGFYRELVNNDARIGLLTNRFSQSLRYSTAMVMRIDDESLPAVDVTQLTVNGEKPQRTPVFTVDGLKEFDPAGEVVVVNDAWGQMKNLGSYAKEVQRLLKSIGMNFGTVTALHATKGDTPSNLSRMRDEMDMAAYALADRIFANLIDRERSTAERIVIRPDAEDIMARLTVVGFSQGEKIAADAFRIVIDTLLGEVGRLDETRRRIPLHIPVAFVSTDGALVDRHEHTSAFRRKVKSTLQAARQIGVGGIDLPFKQFAEKSNDITLESYRDLQYQPPRIRYYNPYDQIVLSYGVDSFPEDGPTTDIDPRYMENVTNEQVIKLNMRPDPTQRYQHVLKFYNQYIEAHEKDKPGKRPLWNFLQGKGRERQARAVGLRETSPACKTVIEFSQQGESGNWRITSSDPFRLAVLQSRMMALNLYDCDRPALAEKMGWPRAEVALDLQTRIAHSSNAKERATLRQELGALLEPVQPDLIERILPNYIELRPEGLVVDAQALERNYPGVFPQLHLLVREALQEQQALGATLKQVEQHQAMPFRIDRHDDGRGSSGGHGITAGVQGGQAALSSEKPGHFKLFSAIIQLAQGAASPHRTATQLGG